MRDQDRIKLTMTASNTAMTKPNSNATLRPAAAREPRVCTVPESHSRSLVRIRPRTPRTLIVAAKATRVKVRAMGLGLSGKGQEEPLEVTCAIRSLSRARAMSRLRKKPMAVTPASRRRPLPVTGKPSTRWLKETARTPAARQSEKSSRN